jgi:hypothetical protein
MMDIGDIELASAIEINVVLDRDPGCPVQAIGPIGKAGMQMVSAVRDPDGSQRILVPESGVWQFVLVCGNERRSLTPPTVSLDGRQSGKELRFRVGEKSGVIY